MDQDQPSLYAQVEQGTISTPRIRSVSASPWFEDSMLESIALPNLPVATVSADAALTIYSYLFAGDSSPHVRSLTPKVVGLLAHHCLLRKGRSTRMFSLLPAIPAYAIDDTYQDLDLVALAQRIKNPNIQSELPGHVISILNDHRMSPPPEINGELLAQIHKEEDILRYIGAMCFMMIRLGVKTPEMIQKYYNEKFSTVYTGVYGRPRVALPLLKLESLREISVTFNNGDPLYKMLVLNATKIAYDAMTDIDKSPDGTVLKGLAMIVIANHSLPLYNWAERVGEKVEKTPLEVMSMIRCGQTHKSVTDMFRFVYAYMATDEEYSKIQDVKDLYGIPDPKNSIYWPVARIMNNNFLSIIGRKGNEDAINILIGIYNRYASSDEKIQEVTYKVPRGKLSPEASRVIAKAFSTAIDQEMSTYETSNALAGLQMFGGEGGDEDVDMSDHHDGASDNLF